MGSLEEAEWEHYRTDPSDRHPDPPLGDAEMAGIKLDELEAEGYYDDLIYPEVESVVVPPLCMITVDDYARPCILPAGHDGDHTPLPTIEEIHGADPG